MVAGLVVISAGAELVIIHPAGRIHPAWIAVILAGVAAVDAAHTRRHPDEPPSPYSGWPSRHR
jgi:hypothetical protein